LGPRLKAELRAPLACQFQGEDVFLDSLPKPQRAECWKIVAARAAEADLLIAPSRYFANQMEQRLGLSPGRVRVLHNGINLVGYREGRFAVRSASGSPEGGPNASPPVSLPTRETQPAIPVLGFFARMCPDKGLDTLVTAYIAIRARRRIKELKLRIGGSCGPMDEPFVAKMRERLRAASVLGDTEFVPNPDHAGKVDFLRSLTVFSVPAKFGEAFGLYLIEAMAAGVPAVQPRSGAFPELIEATGGGLICEPGNPQVLAETIEGLLLDPAHIRALGQAAQRAVFDKFSAETMAQETAQIYREIQLANNPASNI
jgi:glycosyltransferase involved in cell wall biosynthesis